MAELRKKNVVTFFFLLDWNKYLFYKCFLMLFLIFPYLFGMPSHVQAARLGVPNVPSFKAHDVSRQFLSHHISQVRLAQTSNQRKTLHLQLNRNNCENQTDQQGLLMLDKAVILADWNPPIPGLQTAVHRPTGWHLYSPYLIPEHGSPFMQWLQQCLNSMSHPPAPLL